MPELVNIKVGSLPGTKGLDATTVCPLDAKKSKKVLRMSATEKTGWLMVFFKNGALEVQPEIISSSLKPDELAQARSHAQQTVSDATEFVAMGRHTPSHESTTHQPHDRHAPHHPRHRDHRPVGQAWASHH
jgi:hypothetical protein